VLQSKVIKFVWELPEERMKMPFEKGPQISNNLGQDVQCLHRCMVLHTDVSYCYLTEVVLRHCSYRCPLYSPTLAGLKPDKRLILSKQCAFVC